jgi:hypothetical protein
MAPAHQRYGRLVEQSWKRQPKPCASCRPQLRNLSDASLSGWVDVSSTPEAMVPREASVSHLSAARCTSWNIPHAICFFRDMFSRWPAIMVTLVGACTGNNLALSTNSRDSHWQSHADIFFRGPQLPLTVRRMAQIALRSTSCGAGSATLHASDLR